MSEKTLPFTIQIAFRFLRKFNWIKLALACAEAKPNQVERKNPAAKATIALSKSPY